MGGGRLLALCMCPEPGSLPSNAVAVMPDSAYAVRAGLLLTSAFPGSAARRWTSGRWAWCFYERRSFNERLIDDCLFWLCWARRWTFGRWA